MLHERPPVTVTVLKNTGTVLDGIRSRSRQVMSIMPNRTTRSVVQFLAPFTIMGLDSVQPSGDYAIDEDSEEIQGVSWLAFRRIATFIHLPSLTTRSTPQQMVLIDPADLEAALERDRVHALSAP